MKFLITIFFALVLCSCRTTKSVSSDVKKETRTDSVIYKKTVVLDTIRIPAATANVSVPVSQLPDGGTVEKTDGRARVIVYRFNDTIYAEARCDSLEKIIASTNSELEKWHQYGLMQSKTQTITKIQVPFWLKFLFIFLGVTGIAGIAFNVFNYFKIKNHV